ncbi:MAG: hypothetical protein ACI4WG_02595 [Erysipelotrichaceae bacterium]
MEKYILVIIVVVMALASAIIPNMMRNKYQNQFVELFKNGQFEQLEELLNKSVVKYLFMPFNLEYIRLNIALIKEDSQAIDKQIDLLTGMKMTEKQKEDVYIKALNYYVTMDDVDRAKKIYELAMTLKNESLKKSADITYDVFVNKGYKYLDELEKNLDNCPKEYKVFNSYLVALMYEHKGDKQKADYYHDMTEKLKKQFIKENEEGE